MQPDSFAAVASIANAIATLCAAVGLVLTWLAIRSQARSADLASLLAFAETVRHAETRISSADATVEREREIKNYLNFFNASHRIVFNNTPLVCSVKYIAKRIVKFSNRIRREFTWTAIFSFILAGCFII